MNAAKQIGSAIPDSKYRRLLTVCFLLVGLCLHAQAQIHPLVACSINGTSPVTAGQVVTYTLSGCSATSWTNSCGTIQSSTATSVTVYFNVTSCSSSTLIAKSGSSNLATKTITISQPATLTGGSISNSTQTINNNTAPAQINATAATGGYCPDGYVYQWQSSPNNATFTAISGATGQNYQPPALTSTTYYNRTVSCGAQYATTSNSATVTVYPAIQPGTVTPSSQNINYNTIPATLTISSSSGGNGTFSYQWYSSSNNSTWTAVSGATSSSYTPPALTTATYYLCQVISNGAAGNSTSVLINVYAQVQGGFILPSSQTVNYNSAPSTLSSNGVSGGNFSYTYAWQSSPDNSTWTTLSGATASTYNPTAITALTYYRVLVTSNGAQGASSSDTSKVYPQLNPGYVYQVDQDVNNITIVYGHDPGFMFSRYVTGGNGTYTYQWQSSPDQSTWTNVGGATGTSYDPGLLYSNMYYRVAVTSNGVTLYSANYTVTVNPLMNAGNISPANLTVTSGTNPGEITGTPATGGGCGTAYSYQWQSAADGINYTNISGATSQSYSPGAVTANSWFRRQVTCSVDVEYSNASQIVIGSPNTSFNFVRVRNILKAAVTDTVTADGLTSPFDVAQTTQYFDGVGRLVQTVGMQASPLQNDVVVPIVYDNFGRTSIQYLSYTASTNDGNYKATAISDQFNFNSGQFPGEQYYYGETNYEASPENRPLTNMAPGLDWVGNGTGISAQYLINTAADSVQLWSISAVQLSLPVNAGAYAPGQLFKKVMTDEQGHQIIEYKNKTGETILKKIQASANPSSGHAGWLNTYYVYDTLQNLRVIIQPQAVALVDGSWVITQAIANELCFRYEYDGRRRVAIKKAPGAGQVWMVYDARNRLAMTQDSAMRAAKKWLYSKYDSENRPDSSGLITDLSNYSNLAYHDSLAYYSTSYPVVGSYTNELLTEHFYDDYSWVAANGSPVSATMATNYTSNSSYFLTSYNTSPTYAVAVNPFMITRGMMTGSMKKVVGSASQYLYASSFYDDRGRCIQTQAVNYTGAVDTITNQYTFTGSILRTLAGHKKNGNTIQSHTLLTKIDYDHRFRVRHIWKNLDNSVNDQLIDSIQYNELSQVRAKYLGNNIDSLVYAYNIRGWLTGINKSYVAGSTNNYFGMEIGYDKTSSVAPGNTYLQPELNGNIEGIVWKSAGSGINRKYDYTYDPANRFSGAAFLQNTSGSAWDKSYIDYSVSGLNYDANGNILTMTQRGFTAGGSSAVDSLTYSYLNSGGSNKLMGVQDAANNPTSLLGDFHYNPATKQATDYNYDGNGNLIQDNNKAIDIIAYNYLNLPQNVHMNGKGNISYVYDASGSKLAKIITDSTNRHSTTILYIGQFVYQQVDTITLPGGGVDTLQFIAHEEGRIRRAFHKYTNGTTGYKMEYDFFEKDNLGNTRMVLTQQKDTAQYLASMEAAYRATETQLFANITSTCYARASVSGYPQDLTITNPNDSVSKIDYTGTSGQKTGPSLLLKVMSGDTINMAVQSYYNSGTGGTNNSSFNDVLNSLANFIVNTSGGAAHGTLQTFTANNSTLYSGLTSFLNNNDSTPANYPKAYLNWIFLDDQFNYVSSLSGAIPAASSKNTPGKLNAVGPGSPLAITKSGYIYVWVSNETQGWDVFFDNLSIQHKQGPLLEENHYYPFGLAMAGLSDKAIKSQYSENKFRYNGGNEKQDKEFSDGSGWEMYDAGFRMYDQQTGRFGQIDPLADATHFFSTYQFAGNNPVSMNDPNGLFQKSPEVISELNAGPTDFNPNPGGYLTDGIDESQAYTDANIILANSYFISTAQSQKNLAFWTNVTSTLFNGGDGSTWTNNDDGTGTYSFTNEPDNMNFTSATNDTYETGNSNDNANARYPPIKYFYNAQVFRDPDTKEITGVIVDPIVADPLVSYNIDDYGRGVTRTLTLFGQYNSYTQLSATSVMITWSCFVIGVYTYSDGQTPAFTKMWSVSKQSIQ